MANLDYKKSSRPKYPIYVRLIGVFMFLAIAVGNILLFILPIDNIGDWQHASYVVIAVLLFALIVWLISRVIAKIYNPQFSKLQLIVIKFLMFLVIFGASAFIATQLKHL